MKRRLAYLITTFMLAFSFPVGVLADTAPSDSSTGGGAGNSTNATAPAAAPANNTSSTSSNSSAQGPATTPGPASPTGDDSTTYTYNANTGLWENAYYTWNPVTHQTQPKTAQDYSYNPTTGKWDTTQYVYNPTTGAYVPNVVSTPANPQSATALAAPSSDSISTTGPASTNTNNTSSNNNGIFNLFYNAAISNTLTQNAVSGSAAVTGNTVAGNALTGNALDVSNIINMLKSSFGLQNAADLLTFTDNINGNVNGDITIDPNQLNNSSVAVGNNNTQNNLTINAAGSGLINNDIAVGATSGAATVADNNTGGSASSGNADAVSNIVNVLNSAINAGKSFLGVININGNLNGDILLPPNFLDQLIASNAPRATVNINNSTTNNLLANTTNNENIANNVTLGATSGAATVADNTKAGSATTGNAGTNLTIFNLTGQQVAAKNSLLVFVNVLGQWVGLIMNAPAGTTAAELGGNVTENNTLNNNAVINENTNNTINNNVKINSTSGAATVTDNTSAGNATTGNATASANIANILDSQLSASDWFGLLFINVLGFWHGSFGINTDAGNLPSNTSTGSGNRVAGNNSTSPARSAVFGFTPKSISDAFNSQVAAQTQNSNSSGSSPGRVILASKSGGGSASSTSAAPSEVVHHSSGGFRISAWLLPIASFTLIMFVTGALSGSGEFTDKFYARLLSHRLGNRG